MIPTIVQRPKIFDVLEIQSGSSPAICCWLEMVGFKVLYLMPNYTRRRDTAKRYCSHEAGVMRCPTPDPVCIPTKGTSAAGFESIGNAFPAKVELTRFGRVTGSLHLARFFCTWYRKEVTQMDVELITRSFSWTSDEITDPRLRGILLGSSARSSDEFGTKVRVNVLASSPGSLPGTGNLQSDNLRVVARVKNRSGRSDILPTAPMAPKSRTFRVSRHAHTVGTI